MKIICAIFGFVLAIPVVLVAAVLMLGAGAGIITRVFSVEVIGAAVIILLFMLVKRLFK